MMTVGIDAGSVSTKAVLIRDGDIVACRLMPTGYRMADTGELILEALVSGAGLTPAHIHRLVATGYGRHRLTFADQAITEITCHAAGARYFDPAVRTVLDIGGQDSKIIRLREDGRVQDFLMNDRCAAGTGRFLEVMARALEIDLADFGALDAQATAPASVSNLCTVFAESEIISLIAGGERRENIVAGLHNAIAHRMAALSSRLGVTPPVLMTGGVAQNTGVVRALISQLGVPVAVPKLAQFSGAVGAALLGAQPT